MSFLAGIRSKRTLPPGYDKACELKTRKRRADSLDLGNGRTRSYAWGYDVYGRLANGRHVGPKIKTRPGVCPQCKALEKHFVCEPPKEVECLRGAAIRDVVCGPAHTFVVTENDGLFFFGKCHEGQAGVGLQKGPTLDACVDFPIRVPFDRIPVHEIATSVTHVLVASGDRLWSWGEGSYGKLGHGNEMSCYEPKRVESFVGRQIVALGAGRHHSVVAVVAKRRSSDDCDGDDDDDGGAMRVHTFGLDPVTKTATIRNPERHVQCITSGNRAVVSCGYFHSFLVTPDGRALGFGSNEFGELGELQGATKPRPLRADSKVRTIVAGDGWSACLLENGIVLTTGRNEYGQLGSGDRSNRARFLPIRWTKELSGGITHLAAGRQHLVLVGRHRDETRPTIFAIGQNEGGQLGVGTAQSRVAIVRPVVGLELEVGSRARFVLAGTNHTFVVVEATCESDTGSDDDDDDDDDSVTTRADRSTGTETKQHNSALKSCD